MSDLSLFGIESELHHLYDRWQTAETVEEVHAAEAAIIDYGQREVRKVDGIRAYLRVCDEQEKSAAAEAKLQTQRAARWKARADHLKQFVMAVMREFGKTKLEGNTGVLRIQANGGKEPLTITDESLIPDDLCVWVGEIDGPALNAIINLVGPLKWNKEIWPHVRMVRKPDNDAVRARIGMICGHCGGQGTKCPAGPSDAPMETCPECSGTGKRLVPGARIEDRGEHLRVV